MVFSFRPVPTLPFLASSILLFSIHTSIPGLFYIRVLYNILILPGLFYSRVLYNILILPGLFYSRVLYNILPLPGLFYTCVLYEYYLLWFVLSSCPYHILSSMLPLFYLPVLY
jgi:hypothetical protein